MENVLVSLVGQVPVKVSDEHGEIHVGDSITISPTKPGVGAKAHFGDTAVGYALENLQSGDGSIMVYASLHTALGMNPENEEGEAELTAEMVMDRMVALARGFVDGVLKVAGIRTDELCIGETCVDEETLKALLQNSQQAEVPPYSQSSYAPELPPPPTDTGTPNDETPEEEIPEEEVPPVEEIPEEETPLVEETPVPPEVEEGVAESEGGEGSESVEEGG
jgi:hypothetical protein